MSEGQLMELLKEALLVAFKIAGPILGVSIVIGLVVAIFQAATQIHEQTLTFVPKVVAISLILLLFGSWMITMLSDFMHKLFSLMASL